LNTVISDNFHVIRIPFAASGNYGTEDESSETQSYRPIELRDLYNATENLIAEGTPDEQDAARLELSESQGWYIIMERSGEKILGASTTLNNIVRFVSYTPSITHTGCEPSLGSSYFWALNILDGTASDDSEEDIEEDDNETRRNQKIPGNGIAPPVQVLFVADEEATVTPTDVSGINVLRESDNANLTKRWYWAEYPE